MVVDDAIVIVENCYTKLQQGNLGPDQAIQEGVGEVALPVTTSSLTTICAFMPLMMMPGIMGKFMRVIPLVVSVTLLASLFEAFVILPGHVKEFNRLQTGRRAESGLIRLVGIQRGYVKLLVRCLRHRYIFLAGVALLLVLSLVLAALLGFDLFAEDMLPSFKVLVKMPSGTSLEHTEQVVMQIADVVKSLPPEELDHVTLRAGLTQGTELWAFLPTVGQVGVNLVPHHARRRSVEQIANSIRTKVAAIPGPESVEFQFDTQGPPAGADIQILIKGRHLDVLEEISRDLKRRLAEIPGVQDIRDDLNRGTQELTVRVDPDRARRYGVTVHQVASELRTAFNGTTATVLHDGDEDVDVVVRFAAQGRTEMADVLGTHFRTPSGDMVAFEDIASLSEELGLSNIRRHDSERAITVRASIDSSQTTLSRAVDRARSTFPDIERRYPGYRLSIWGQWKEFVEAFSSLGLLFGFGLLLIYLLLVRQFKSLIQPLVILVIVPLSFIGAALGLLLLQRPVTVPTLYGFVALAGIAVNDSIVLVQFINSLRQRLADRRHSLVMAGQQRLRPIILTSVTTTAGLLPMAIGIGGGTSAYQSLAVVVVAGLVISTGISLFGIPVLIHITDDLKTRLGFHKPVEPSEVKIILKPTTPRAASGGSDG
jgi:multidrug efflux pump subunit AcrB